VVSDEADAESFVTARLADPAVQAPSSLISLQEVNPDHGPLSGGEKILLVGYGFSEDQDLLVRFGYGTMPVSAKWVNQHILRCKLPPSDSARRVVVTLHWRDRSDVIPNEGDVYFTYKDVDKELSVHIFYVLVWY
jgi:IPT/TIG domain